MKTRYIRKKDNEDLVDSERLRLEALEKKLQLLIDRAPFETVGVSLEELRELLRDPEAFDA